jgi:hypothetical protein
LALYVDQRVGGTQVYGDRVSWKQRTRLQERPTHYLATRLAARDKTAAGSRDQLWDGLDEWLKPSPLLEVGQAIGISTPT